MCIAEVANYGCLPKMGVIIDHINVALKENKMCLNPKKSNVIIKDNSRKRSYSNYEICVDGTQLPIVDKCKLLDIIINKKCKWSDHINHVYERACKKLYIMRKLRSSGFSRHQLVCMYSTHIRSILEYGCILWAFSINKDLIKRLNSVEQRVLSIIAGRYVSINKHENVCKDLGMVTLITIS